MSVISVSRGTGYHSSSRGTGYHSSLSVSGVFDSWDNLKRVMEQTTGGLMINNLSGKGAWYLQEDDTVLGNYPLKPSHWHLMLRQMTGNRAIVVARETKNIQEYVDWMKLEGLVPGDFLLLTPQQCGVKDLAEVYWLAAYYTEDFQRVVKCNTGYYPEKIIWYLPPPVTLPGAEELIKLGNKSEFRTLLSNLCPQWAIPTISRVVKLDHELIEKVIRDAFELNGFPKQEGETSAVVVQIPTLDGGLGTLVVARRRENGEDIFYKKEGGKLLRYESLLDLAITLRESLQNEYKSLQKEAIPLIASPFLGKVEITEADIQLTVRSGSFGLYYHKTENGLECYTTPVRCQVLEGLSYRGFILDTSSENLPFSSKELEEVAVAKQQLAMILGRFVEGIKPGTWVQVNIDFIIYPSGEVRICELNPRPSAVQGGQSMMYYVVSEASRLSGEFNLPSTITKYTKGEGQFELFPGGNFCMYQYDHFVPDIKTRSGQAPNPFQISHFIQSRLNGLGVPVVQFNPSKVPECYGQDVIYFQFMTPVSEEPPYKLAVLFIAPPRFLGDIRNFIEGRG